MSKLIAVLNGPNLNRLGKREPEIYGNTTLEDILSSLCHHAELQGYQIDAFQSNHEGELVERIHAWSDAGITRGIINPAAFTHTSVALRDAIGASAIRFVEVHISHVYQREEFRHHSFTAPVCCGQICGLGSFGYRAALDFLLQLPD